MADPVAIHPRLGVCYYPEHWPEELWAEDARKMVDLGLSVVRIGEFSWSRLEPGPGEQNFDWLSRAIDTLAEAGLDVVLGTPTATPPKWLVDQMPDMLAVDAGGQARGFGSRRHYCFSHMGYRAECARIVTALATRFGRHDAIVAWQTDNEYGCHDTTLSFSAAARDRFRDWLAVKYQSPQALNRAWGNVFWSMEFREFDEIPLPNRTVTEANPAHWMDFRRFASDEVVAFNRVQTEILRMLSPGRDLIHNFMGRETGFDHFDVGGDLDVASWDSYPLGFLEDRSDQPNDRRLAYLRAGDPDFQALHHDLYRATTHGRWWVMEQQPGPVNWAPHNPAPRDGMVRLWAWEALAHGAEVVSYFRWRQAPFAQEQMHAGLLRPDNAPAPGQIEARAVASEIATVGPLVQCRAKVAIVWDYPSHWAWDTQRQGAEFSQFRLVFDLYAALRRLGLSIDVLSSTTSDVSAYQLVLIPGLFAWSDALRRAVASKQTRFLIGPRSGSKTEDFTIPAQLPPDLGSALLDLKIARVETLPHGAEISAEGGGAVKFWREFAEPGPDAKVVISTLDDQPLLIRQGAISYLAGWPDAQLAGRILRDLCDEAKIATHDLPKGLRFRRTRDLTFAVNYSDASIDLGPQFPDVSPVLGDIILPPSGVAAFPNSSNAG